MPVWHCEWKHSPHDKTAIIQFFLLSFGLLPGFGLKGHISLIHHQTRHYSYYTSAFRLMLNAWQPQTGITWEHSVLHPWRPVDDVTSIHWGRLRGQCWPTSRLSKTQRGTGLLPFPRGSGVTAAYKKRIPTGTLHPQSPSTPNPCTLLFCLEIPWDVCGISMTTATDGDGVTLSRDAAMREFRWEWGRNVRVTRYKSSSRWGWMKILKAKAVKTCKR